MKKFDKDELLDSSIPDEKLRAEAREHLLACLAICDRGGFRLRSKDDLDAKKYASIIEDCTGWSVSGVDVMSLSDPFPRPSWLSPHAHERAKSDIIGESFLSRFTQLPKNSVDDIALDSEIRMMLNDAVRKTICHRLKDAAETSYRILLAKSIDVSMAQDLQHGLCEILFRYLCFAASGEDKEAERLGRLLRKYVKSPVLGLLKNSDRHKGTPLVLCA